MRRNAGIFDTLIGLLLMCVFSACALLVLASGARIYKEISDNLEGQYTGRTAVSYIATKLRSSQNARIGELGGQEALVMREEDEDGVFVTYIYMYDGSLCELYCYEGDDFLPSDGERLMKLDSVAFSTSGGLFTVECGDFTQSVYMRGGAA